MIGSPVARRSTRPILTLDLPCNARSIGGALALLIAVIFAGSIALLPLSLAVMAVVAVCLVLVIVIRPVVGLLTLALAVPFGSLAEFQIGGMGIGAVEAFVGLVFVVWFAALLARRERFLRVPWPTLPIMLFVALIAFELTLAPSLPASIKELLRWGELLAVALAGANILRTKRQTVLLLAALLVAGAGEAIVGWYQFFLHVGPPSFSMGRFLRAYGTFSQPNPFAGYLAMLWPLALCIAVWWLARWARSRRTRPRTSPVFSSVARRVSRGAPLDRGDCRLAFLALAATLVCGLALLMSFSRGAWMGIAVAILVMAGLYRRQYLLALVGIVGLAVAIVVLGQFNLVPAAIGERVNDVVDYFRIFDVRTVVLTPANWAIVQRMASWQAAWSMFESSPVFGVGPGHYDIVYRLFAVANWPESLGHAHNYYLNTLAEMGVIGLSSYLLVLAGWFVGGFVLLRNRKANSNGFDRAVIVGVLGSLAAGSVHNFFDNLYVHGMNVHVGLLLAVMLAVGRHGSASLEASSSRPTRVLEEVYD